MEEKQEVAGQIKINVPERGPIEVIIKGHIRIGVISRLQYDVRKAWRKHVALLNKEREAAKISPDKGIPLEEVPDLINQQADPGPPEPLKTSPDLSAPPMTDIFEPEETEPEQANNPEGSEEEDGTNKGTEGIRSSDEESGSEGSAAWKV